MKFLVDAQLPPALAEWLRDQGHEADHIFARDQVDADDETIWALALAEARIIVTKDRDFAEWAFARRPSPRVLWLRFGNMRNTALRGQFGSAWPRITQALAGDGLVVEAR